MPPSTSAQTAAGTTKMSGYLAAVTTSNASTAATVVATGARPTITEQSGRVTTMVIRDEGANVWAKGNYRLVIYCAGTGTLYAYFELGGESEIQELLPCAPTVSTGTVDLALPNDASASKVMIIPAGETEAAVAYQIQRV